MYLETYSNEYAGIDWTWLDENDGETLQDLHLTDTAFDCFEWREAYYRLEGHPECPYTAVQVELMDDPPDPTPPDYMVAAIKDDAYDEAMDGYAEWLCEKHQLAYEAVQEGKLNALLEERHER